MNIYFTTLMTAIKYSDPNLNSLYIENLENFEIYYFLKLKFERTVLIWSTVSKMSNYYLNLSETLFR